MGLSIVVFATVALAAISSSVSGARIKGAQKIKIKQDIKYTTQAEMDRVSNLPGWGALETFNMFSG